jgi:hypothetical protein
MELYEIITIFAVTCGAIFTIIGQFFLFKNKTGTVTRDVIETYKTRIDQLEQRVSICESLHRDNLGEIGRLKGVSEEKDKRITILESVDLKRNPELLIFMKETTEALTSVKNFFNDLGDGTFVISKKVS